MKMIKSLEELKQQYDEVVEASTQWWEWEYYLIRIGKKWGVASFDIINEGDDPIMIPPMFDKIVHWNKVHHYYAIVGNDGKYGIVGNGGKVIVPLEYDEVDTFGFLCGHKWHVRKGGEWFYVQEGGEPWDGVEPAPYNPL